MCETAACIEVVRSAEAVYVLDTKDYSKGPVQILPTDEYLRRVEGIVGGNPADSLFDTPDQRQQFQPGEYDAFARYAAAQRVGELAIGTEYNPVVAYSDLRDLA